MFTNDDLKSILHNNNKQQISNVCPNGSQSPPKDSRGGGVGGKLLGAKVAVFHSINASTEVTCF